MATTIEKQYFIRKVFDNQLYYKDTIYRTPYMIEAFTHNNLILREKKLLIYEKKRDNCKIIPSGGAGGNRTRVQTSAEKAFYMLIPLLVVDRCQEADKPNFGLAGWS